MKLRFIPMSIHGTIDDVVAPAMIDAPTGAVSINSGMPSMRPQHCHSATMSLASWMR